MKTIRILSLIMALFTLSTTGCANQSAKPQQEGKKVLVAYFSATGNTAAAARKLANVTGGTLLEIAPAQPYTSDDLDWNDKQSRSSVEMNDPKSRPALKATTEKVADYDVIYLGYPIWWGVAPHVINTFIETHDLKGKTVVPFATSGGSNIIQSVSELKKAYPDVNWKDGKLLNRASEDNIRQWVEQLDFDR